MDTGLDSYFVHAECNFIGSGIIRQANAFRVEVIRLRDFSRRQGNQRVRALQVVVL